MVVTHALCAANAHRAVAMLAEQGDARKCTVLVFGDAAVGDASSGQEATPLGAFKGTGKGVASLGVVGDHQLAVLPYSSGTTGLPKGEINTHTASARTPEHRARSRHAADTSRCVRTPRADVLDLTCVCVCVGACCPVWVHASVVAR